MDSKIKDLSFSWSQTTENFTHTKRPFANATLVIGHLITLFAHIKKAGASVFVYQRRREKLEEVCRELGMQAADDPESGGYDILVNCTGVGMHETVGISPVSAQAFDGAGVAVDLIYTPSESEFLRLAKARGLRTLNGAAMLFYQAYFSDCLYLNRAPGEREVEELYQEYRKEKKS